MNKFDIGDKVYVGSQPAVVVGIFNFGLCLLVCWLDTLPKYGEVHKVIGCHWQALKYRTEPMACRFN